MGAGSHPISPGVVVLYYGDPMGPERHRLREVDPDLLIVPSGYEGRADVVSWYKSARCRVLVYIPLGYGTSMPVKTPGGARSDSQVEASTGAHSAREEAALRAVDVAMTTGFDGVFFDEAPSRDDGVHVRLAARVRAHGRERTVVLNPGVAQVDESLFRHADIVSVENHWNTPLAPCGVEPWRWMALQGDPAADAARDLRDAIDRYETFRAQGGGWYYSPPRCGSGSSHWLLAPWLEQFVRHVRLRVAAPSGG